MIARRDPLFAFVFEESLFAFAYATPPCEFALLYERPTTRPLRELPPISFYPIAVAARYAATLSALTQWPRKARRDPKYAYELEES